MFGIASIKTFINQKQLHPLFKKRAVLLKNSRSVGTLIFLLVIVFAYLTSWQAPQLSIIPFTLFSTLTIRRVILQR